MSHVWFCPAEVPAFPRFGGGGGGGVGEDYIDWCINLNLHAA